MRRPPAAAVFVARTHWLVGAAIFLLVGVLHLFTRHWPVEFGWETYAITLGLGTLYSLAGTLVWLGLPSGRLLSRICGLLYLARPQLGSRLWNVMDSAEYQAHFTKTSRYRGAP